MRMEHWETRQYEITLKPGVDPKYSKVRGIVVHNAIGIHRDPDVGGLVLTDLGSGKRFQNIFFDLLVAVEEAQRLSIEGWPQNEVE